MSGGDARTIDFVLDQVWKQISDTMARKLYVEFIHTDGYAAVNFGRAVAAAAVNEWLNYSAQGEQACSRCGLTRPGDSMKIVKVSGGARSDDALASSIQFPLEHYSYICRQCIGTEGVGQ